MQNLTKKWKKPAVVILDSGAFILQFISSVLVAKNHQKIRFRCLVHKFSFIDVF